MIEERLDLAIRAGDLDDSSLVMRRTGVFGRVVVAAPAYLERHAAPSVPEDLTHHICLVHDTEPDSDLWRFTSPGNARTLNVRVSGRLIANGSATLLLSVRRIRHRPPAGGAGVRRFCAAAFWSAC